MADLEEFRPQHFFIRNSFVRPLIKREGKIEGNHFELTSWRREGMLARLRQAGFSVVTLEDQLEALPTLPAAWPIGVACVRAVSPNDRYSIFDPQLRAWVAAAAHPADPAKVVLHGNQVLRRRRGRGAASYYRVVQERSGNAGITPLGETEALLQGYAQAAQVAHTPLVVIHKDASYTLPTLPLPPPYTTLLQRIATQTDDGWQTDEPGWPLAGRLYARLGVRLEAEQWAG